LKAPTGYLTDLAYVHDAGFKWFANSAAKGLLDIFRRHNLKRGRIVELGCGSGTLARIFLKKGYTLHGIDYSQSMVLLARTNAPSGTFVVGSLWNSAVPRCDIVLSVGECLNYEFAAHNTPEKLRKLFGRVHAALTPGGLFAFDFLCERQPQQPVPQYRFTEGSDWHVAVERHERRNIITRRIVTFRKIGRNYRRSVEVHVQRRFRRQDIRKMLEKAGFSIEFRKGYDRQNLGDGHAVVVAAKPKRSARVPRS
jgi:SAM-dependent methyltransferase